MCLGFWVVDKAVYWLNKTPSLPSTKLRYACFIEALLYRNFVFPHSFSRSTLERWNAWRRDVISTQLSQSRCKAYERCCSIGRFAVWAFGTNASFKPPWHQRSLVCIAANLIFLVPTASLNLCYAKASLHWNFVLNPFCIKTQSLCMQSDCGAG